MSNRFRSLRVRLLLPVLAVALFASIAVALGSYVLGDKWAREEMDARFQSIEATLNDVSFPLSSPVVASVASLTATEIVTVSIDGRVLEATFDTNPDSMFAGLAERSSPSESAVRIDGKNYRYASISRGPSSGDPTREVLVFFDESALRSMRVRAAALPLLTGLSTVILLTSVTLFLATRLIRRLSRLQGEVESVAAGDFETHVEPGPGDEIGKLGDAVGRMGQQLQSMWVTLQRQQGQKLLHQLAGGMAHQLRNSITGARMAIELHGAECQRDDESLAVALRELEQTESSMKRLLIAASGQQDADQPQSIRECLAGIRETLDATARHLHVSLSWNVDREVESLIMIDGPSLNAAVTNLVLNAMQAAKVVEVGIDRHGDQVHVQVLDDGSGPPAEVQGDLFEPFVTSKPEGLGLGLPLVRQSAQRLGGSVEWQRDQGCTRFTMSAKILDSRP